MRAMTVALAVIVLVAAPVAAQPVFRLLGQVADEKGAPLAGADVNVEALYGYAAGTFAGQRTFSAKSDAKGRWNVMGVKAGIWIVQVTAPGYVPETVGLPIMILTTVSAGRSGMSLDWTLPLKVQRMPDGDRGQSLSAALDAARAGRKDDLRAALTRLPEGSDADYLSSAGRIAVVGRDFQLAQSLFTSALQRDQTAYRIPLGLATNFLALRDFDSASKAFDAARARTRDKDEQRFISVALAELASIVVR